MAMHIPPGGDPKNSRHSEAGGIPSYVTGGTIKAPLSFKGGVNGPGKGPKVSQAKPAGTRRDRGTKMKMKRAGRSDRLKAS